MPPPRKVDLLPEKLLTRLQSQLKERGFSGYVELAEDLNAWLEAEGLELRIGKSTLATYGQEYEHFVKYQREASAWAEGWMQDQGLADEAKRHGVLFQMLTTLAFKAMEGRMTADAGDIDVKELHFIGRMLKDVMASSGLREKLIAEDRKAQGAALEAAVAQGDINAEAAEAARRILGFS